MAIRIAIGVAIACRVQLLSESLLAVGGALGAGIAQF